MRKAKCRRAAVAKLQKVGNEFVQKQLLQAWLEDHRESSRARRWFNREAGSEGAGEDAAGEWYWEEGADPISLLPRDMAVKIFMLLNIQALSRCGLVCHSWKDITHDTRLWNKADFHSIGHFVRDEEVMKICHKFRPLLCHLNLKGCVRLSSDGLKAIGYCQNLQDLNLSEAQGINEDVVQSIGKGCKGLLYLNLSYCYVTDSILRILFKHYSSLSFLSLGHCIQFTSKGLFSITSGKGCRRLSYLDLCGCTQLLADGLGYISKGCQILNTLVMDDIPDCDDAMIFQLASHCRTLRHISFMGGSKVGDKGFKYLVTENKRLQTMKIENNNFLTDLTLRAFGKCKELNHLYLAGCSKITDQGMRALAHLKKLQVLNVADCVRISDAGVRYVIDHPPGLGPNLKELNLTNLTKIGDVTLLRISQHCRSLTCLSVCYCENISDAGVEVLGQIPSLASLDISGCNIQDDGIKGLCSNPQFRYLMLAELPEITDYGLQKMSSNLSQLDTLDLSDCEQVSDEGIEQVTFHCRMLRILYLANCNKVTDASTKCIAKGCPYISQLDMSGCSITDRSLTQLRKFSSSLKRLDILCCMEVTREAVLKLKGVEVNYNTDQPKFLHNSDTLLSNLPPLNIIDRI